ncbi:hypothetical protein [Sphingomonas sp. 28-63-12]|uniref:hypothetical protein n=1 Tax=Sphingomonas sp. 28-63-12 TaxID=1970434 RepID=UPI000BD4AAD2|nr:MAG: hypothetical protein B7Y47_00515 [Sphingomonas sp. 28-63-12]
MTGYFDSPWPGEDGTPDRGQAPRIGAAALTGPLRNTARTTLMSTMTVLGRPGAVYLLTHDVLRANLGLPTRAQVERIDPETLAPIERSPRLPGGPMWPGGIAVHANGDLYVVYGRWAHRLDHRCRVKAALHLPVNQPYNSFVILDCGLIVTKNLSDATPAQLTVINPDTLRIVATLDCPEASIARLSATGDTVYVVGVRSIFRYHWTAGALVRDRDWQHDYVGDTRQSYGWDVVLALGQAWFMDNGRHRYRTSMIGRGVSPTANRLIRVALDDSGDHAAIEISGLPGGSITNPPLVDAARGIVIAFDSANRFLRAWRFDRAARALTPLWERAGFGCASHMVLLSASGQIVTNDYRRGGEEVVLLDIETGAEQGRTRIGGITQGVVFPSIGWSNDVYWCSMRRVARVFG